jgi:hypothetical protein
MRTDLLINEVKLNSWFARQHENGYLPACPKCGSFNWKLHSTEVMDDLFNPNVEIYISCIECGLKMLYKTLPLKKVS